MILCDYITDIGFVFKRIRPLIKGLDKSENQFIDSKTVIEQISNYVSTDSYFEVDDKSGFCSLPNFIRRRTLILENDRYIYELDYPNIFSDFDWSIFEDLGIKIQTQGERLQDFFLNLKL